MFTVIITEKGGEQRRMDFDKPEVTIGRVQGNDIILPKGNVSKRHSRIVLKDGKFIIVDLKSTNGTYVNGRKITSPLVLKETDKVYIGDFIITLEEGAGAGAFSGEKPQLTGSATPIPPPALPSGVYEPGLPMPAASGPPSLVSNPPPVPRRAPPAAPPSPPATTRRPAVEPPDDLDLDDEDEVSPPARPAAAVAGRDATMPPSRGGPSIPRPAPPGGVGRTTARDDVPVAAAAAMAAPIVERGPKATVPMPVMVSPAVATPPAAVSSRGSQPVPPAPPAETGPRPRATVRNMEAQPPPSPSPPSAPVGAATAAVSERAVELQREIGDRVSAQLDLARLPMDRLSDEALWQKTESALVDVVEQLEADGALPSGIDQDSLVKDALNELLGIGPLDELLGDDEAGDVLINRPDRILVERGGRLMPSMRVFSSEATLRLALERLLAPSGRKLDSGLVDARLTGGIRLTAALPPLAVRGPAVTLRKPRRGAASLDELVKGGTLSPGMASFLATCITARRNVVVCGSAGAGKSVLIGALAGLVPAGERVVSVEEVAELQLPHEGWIPLEAQAGGIHLTEVVRAALRLRPDRLVVGEIRGVEALEVLSAFAAGEGGLAAVGGDGPAAALARLESLARLAAPEASARGLRELCAHAAHVVVHVARYADGVRRVAAISEVGGATGDGWSLRELFSWQMQGHGADGVRGRFAAAGVVPRFYSELEARGEKPDSAVFR